jgi:dephospho-CoA kinase
VKRVALTGGIATGKSHVRAQFEELGVPTIDADVVARAAVAPGTAGLAAVVERFGRAVLDPSGSLDRRKLAEVVFADPGARHALEAIVHPVVQKTIDDWFAALGSRHLFAVADIPLLFETGRAGEFDKVIVTACAPETQLRRIMQRDHLTEEEARLRIVAQLPLEEKVRKADHVIRTDRAVDATNAEVRTVVERLTRELAG